MSTDPRVVVSCPACGAKADRMQRSEPSARAAMFIVYPCQCWLTPRSAHGLRATYQEAVERARAIRSADAESASEPVPALGRTDGVENPWT